MKPLIALLLLIGWTCSVQSQPLERQTYTARNGDVSHYYLLEPEQVYAVQLRVDGQWWQAGVIDMRGEPFAFAYVLEPDFDWGPDDMLVQDMTAAVRWYEETFGVRLSW